MAAGRNDVLTITELASYLKISKSTLYKLAHDGKVPGQTVGRHWRFHKNAIDAWLGEYGTGSKPRSVVRQKLGRFANGQ